MGLVDNLIAQFQAQQERANAANEQRFQQGLDIFDRIIAQNQPGGTLEKATEATIGRAKTQSVAQGTQSLVSSGLASTTQAAGLGKKFEEEVGVPARLQAADIAGQRLSGALRDKAGFIERREDTGPSFSDIAGLAKSIGAGRQARRVQPASQSFSEPTNFFGNTAADVARQNQQIAITRGEQAARRRSIEADTLRRDTEQAQRRATSRRETEARRARIRANRNR